MRALGSIMFVVGILGLSHFCFSFDASVPSVDTNATQTRIINQGLEADRTCGCIASAGLLIAGAVLSAAGEFQKLLSPTAVKNKKN
jgi:hypothetical protein